MQEEKTSLAESAYERIKEKIICGKYAPEQLLYETELAIELGMSRQPVHQAVQRLFEEGWFSSIARRNIRVQGICLDNIEELYCIRKVLERSALHEIFEKGIYWKASFQLEECLLHMQENCDDQLAFRKWHYEFYARMLKAFSSPMLEKLYVQAGMEHILRINLIINGNSNDTHFSEIIAETAQLIAAIRGNRAEEADDLYLNMWEKGKKRLGEQLSLYMKEGGKEA